MKKSLKYSMLLISFVILLNCPKDSSVNNDDKLSADNKANTCIVTYINGKSYKINEKKSNETPLSAGDMLYENDTVKTDEKSVMEIKIGDKSLIRLKENTELKVITLFKDQLTTNTKINLDTGKIYAKPEDLNPGSNFEINTKSVTAGVRGTEFIVYVPEGQDITVVAVNEGTVTVKKNIQLNTAAMQKIKDIDPSYAEQIEKNVYTELILKKDEKSEINNAKIYEFEDEINNKIANIANEMESSKNSDIKIKETIEKNEKDISELKNKSDQLLKKAQVSGKEWNEKLNKTEFNNFKTDETDKNTTALKPENDDKVKKDETQVFVEKIVKLPGTLQTNLSEKYTAVTCDAENIYVINDIDNTLYCINPANGFVKWKFRHDKLTKIQSPAAANGNAVIVSTYNDIFIINKNGSLMLDKEITNGTSFWAMPVLYKNTVFIPTSRTIYYYDNTLESLSDAEFTPSSSQMYISQSNNIIYGADSLNKQLFAYDFTKKTIIWTSIKLSNIILSAPIWTGKYLISADSSGIIYRFDIKNGKTEPDMIKSDSGIISNIIVYGQNFYFIAKNGWLYSSDINSFASAQKTAQADFKPDQDKYLIKKIVYFNDHIYFASDNGSLFDYDLKSKSHEFIKSDIQTDAALIGSPVIINGSIYVLDINSNIFIKKKEPLK